MSVWNYRLIRHDHPEEPYIEVVEMHYSDEAATVPNGYGEAKVGGSSIKEIKWQLNRMREALSKPILDSKTLKEI